MPKYKHDCSSCEYLGTITFQDSSSLFPPRESEEGTFDCYYCPSDLSGPNLVARFSYDGPDYLSGLVFGQKGAIPSLVAAYAMAIALGKSFERSKR